MTHLDLDRIEGLAGRLRESKAEVLRLLAKDAGSLKAASVISGWIWDTDSALADLTALITRIRELEGALELPDADSLINISVKNGVLLSITVGANVLVNAVKYDPLLVAFDEHGESYEPEVTDVAKWLDAIITALRSEEEDGTTLVHRMLDKAAIEAIESGAEGIKTGDDLKDEHRARTALQRKTP